MTHKLMIRTLYAQATDRHGQPRQLPFGKSTTCTCGLAAGSAPGRMAERTFEQHLADISSGQEVSA